MYISYPQRLLFLIINVENSSIQLYFKPQESKLIISKRQFEIHIFSPDNHFYAFRQYLNTHTQKLKQAKNKYKYLFREPVTFSIEVKLRYCVIYVCRIACELKPIEGNCSAKCYQILSHNVARLTRIQGRSRLC